MLGKLKLIFATLIILCGTAFSSDDVGKAAFIEKHRPLLDKMENVVKGYRRYGACCEYEDTVEGQIKEILEDHFKECPINPFWDRILEKIREAEEICIASNKIFYEGITLSDDEFHAPHNRMKLFADKVEQQKRALSERGWSIFDF